jgi:hypothetical protein
MSLIRVGNYSTSTLYVTRVEDEDGNTSFEFKDKQGRMILHRDIMRTSSGKENYDTYYIYDDLDNLVAVLPPEASSALNGSTSTSWNNTSGSMLSRYTYLYKYNNRHLQIAKKLPGRNWIFYVYDKSDRLIFLQDGNQRQRGEWSFTIPDLLGRECFSGICKNTLNPFADPLLSTLIRVSWYANIGGTSSASGIGTYKGYDLYGTTLTSPTILSANYYDDYSFLGKNGFPAATSANVCYDTSAGNDGFGQRCEGGARGLLTGALTAQLNGSSAPTYLYSVMYYDGKERMVQSKSSNQLSGGIDKEYLAYNFIGQPIKKKIVHSATGKTTQTELYTYTYDNMGRLLTTKHKLNAGDEKLLVSNTYDELGRLKENKPLGLNTLKTNYTYNIRSWTKTINNLSFKEKLYYNDSLPSGIIAAYNGNVAAMDWSANETKTRRYGFTYDALTRLSAANYSETNGNAGQNYSTSYHKATDLSSNNEQTQTLNRCSPKSLHLCVTSLLDKSPRRQWAQSENAVREVSQFAGSAMF